MHGKQATSVLYASCQMKMRVKNVGVVVEKVSAWWSKKFREECCMCVVVEDVCGSDPVSCDECLTGVWCDNDEYADHERQRRDDESRGG